MKYYKRINTCANTRLVFLLYVCMAHTHKPNLYTRIQFMYVSHTRIQ